MVSRLWRGSRGSPAQRSIAVRTISTQSRWRSARFAALVAGAGPLPKRIRSFVPELKRLVEPAILGDPMRPLIWVSKSMDKLAETLTAMGHPIGADTVRKELVKLGFSRQHNRKADEGSKHPDRNAGSERLS